jgi:putative ABC transport system permease protein
MKVQNGVIHLIKMAFSDFKRNKVRTFLTSLGIMIGVLSVVMLLALGLGLKNYMKQQFEDLGTNLLMVMPGAGFGDGGSIGQGFTSLAGSIRFDDKDYRSLSRMSTAKYVVPGHIASLTLEGGNNTKAASVQGVSEDFDNIFNLEVLAGEFFDGSDVASSAKVGVIAETLAKDLFGGVENAVGKTVRAKSLRVKIIGAVKNMGDPEQDNSIMVPYTTTYLTLNPEKEFLAFYIGVSDEEMMAKAIEEIEDILLRRYEEDEFEVIEPSKFLDAFAQILNAVNAVLIAIGSISLIVGGIGIMNIMYATVTERTKEVGIRRAIGATEKDILYQFLVESTILSLMGGLTGLAIAASIVFLVRYFFPLEINLLAIVLSLGISSLIGIFFGVLPAKRAANLTPIEAIRFK